MTAAVCCTTICTPNNAVNYLYIGIIGTEVDEYVFNLLFGINGIISIVVTC